MAKKRNVTRDLLTGEWRPLVLKAGDGHHVKLRRDPGEPVAVPGMAHFAGTGPDGMTCNDCFYFGDITTPQNKWRKERVERDACARAMALSGGIVQPGGLRGRRACKYFAEKPSDQGE